MAVWNPTIANLTLMALGSSAPEILLSVIETVTTLGSTPGELGPSTIVGSAAFNLLIISAVSIISVGPTPKKIEGYGVFVITTTSSVFAYIWLWIVLQGITPDVVDEWEAALTLLFFFILVIFAFGADKLKQILDKRKKKKENQDPNEPSDIRYLFEPEDFIRIVEYTLSGKPLDKEEKKKKQKMKEFCKENFDTEDITKVEPHKLHKAMKPQSVIGSIKYRRQIGDAITGRKDIVITKGTKFSQQEKHAKDIAKEDRNRYYGFPCLHYSVSEGAGHLEIEVANKS